MLCPAPSDPPGLRWAPPRPPPPSVPRVTRGSSLPESLFHATSWFGPVATAAMALRHVFRSPRRCVNTRSALSRHSSCLSRHSGRHSGVPGLPLPWERSLGADEIWGVGGQNPLFYRKVSGLVADGAGGARREGIAGSDTPGRGQQGTRNGFGFAFQHQNRPPSVTFPFLGTFGPIPAPQPGKAPRPRTRSRWGLRTTCPCPVPPQTIGVAQCPLLTRSGGTWGQKAPPGPAPVFWGGTPGLSLSRHRT